MLRTINCIIAGVGGQGTVLLSQLIGDAALEKGWFVRGTETIGMAQRGGNVISHVRIGSETKSPLISYGGADLILAFEPGEAVRALPFLKKGGNMVVLNQVIAPITSLLMKNPYQSDETLRTLENYAENIWIILPDKLPITNTKTVNVAMLGVLIGLKLLPFTEADMLTCIKKRILAQYHEVNALALQAGIQYANEWR